MTAWVSKQSGNWSRASNNADSPWYDAGAQAALSSYPGGAGAGDTAQIGDGVTANQVITLDADPANSLAGITNGDSTSYIAVATTRAIALTASIGVDYNGTNTSGFVRCSANTLTLTGAGAGTTTAKSSAAGYTLLTSGSGSIVVSNSGGIAIDNTSIGRCCSFSGTGTARSIVGTIQASAGRCLFTDGGTTGVTGDTSVTNGYGIYMAGGTVNFTGMPGCTPVSQATAGVYVTSGTLNWMGTHTISTGSYLLDHLAGTTNLGTAGTALAITNSGAVLIIKKYGGTLNTEYATFNNNVAAAQTCIMGQAVTVNGPTLPAEADVESGTEYGYSGDLQTGTLVASGGGGFVQSGSGRFGVQEN